MLNEPSVFELSRFDCIWKMNIYLSMNGSIILSLLSADRLDADPLTFVFPQVMFLLSAPRQFLCYSSMLFVYRLINPCPAEPG